VGNTPAHICEVTNSIFSHQDMHSQVYCSTPRSLGLDLNKRRVFSINDWRPIFRTL